MYLKNVLALALVLASAGEYHVVCAMNLILYQVNVMSIHISKSYLVKTRHIYIYIYKVHQCTMPDWRAYAWIQYNFMNI